MTTLAAYLDRTAADLTATVGTTPLVGVQTYVGLPTGGVELLRTWYAAAIDWCHIKLSKRDFVDSAGASIAPPDACVLAVYEFVKVLKQYHAREAAGIKKIKTGNREEEYTDTPANAITAAGNAAWLYLELVIEDPSLLASGRG